MERQFQLNWPAIVEEARQRRKSLNLTQRRLAMLAKVSTPTLSRFENGAKDIQLSSILNILGMLGMIDQRRLIFPKVANVQYDNQHERVIFWGEADGKKIRCAIAVDIMMHRYKSKNKNPIKVFLENQAGIQHEAVKKYLYDRFESDGFILIKVGDF